VLNKRWLKRQLPSKPRLLESELGSPLTAVFYEINRLVELSHVTDG